MLVAQVLFVMLLAAGSKAKAVPPTFETGGHRVRYEVFEPRQPRAPLIVMLPSSAGPDAFRSQAKYFAGKGYEVLLLHYFDASPTQAPTDRNYDSWLTALNDLIKHCRSDPLFAGRPVYVVGYSLGASIALAAGSQGLHVSAIAEWYGSLPDQYFHSFTGMPPLLILHGGSDQTIPVQNAYQMIRLCQAQHLECANQIYPDQIHGFFGVSLVDAHTRTIKFFQEH